MLLVVVIAIVAVFIMGHYGLPETVNPHDFQETPPAIKIMRGAESFRLQGKTDIGFLLVHGFEDSPFTMRNLGELLHREGHTAIAPLLAGHGTNIKDFARTRYEHWLQTVRDTYARERPRFRHFFLVGFSMGGNLCLTLAAEVQRNLPPTGMICISAPVTLNGILNGRLLIRDPRLFFSGIIKNFITYIPKRQGGISEKVMNPWVGYGEAYTLPALHSFKLGVGHVKAKLYRIKQPICLVHARGDKTVDIENMHYIFRKISAREKRAHVFSLDENLSTHHVLVTHQLVRDKVYHYVIEFVHDTLRNFELRPMLFNPGGSKKSWLAKLRKFRGFFDG